MNLSISHLLAQYSNNTLIPEQVIDDILQKCRLYEDHNIWIKLFTPEELSPYLNALAKHTPDSLPLYGIPFAIKDNIDLAGVNTTAACREFEYTATETAHVLQQLIAAGAIPIGKTNMDQFATGLVGTRSPWGECKNAFNKDYISGGSSSGSAVAVALGLASFSLGTDTAGSGRVPAALNNLVGLKPSCGLISNHGIVPACRSLDCVSIFALDCDDAQRVFSVAVSEDDRDSYSRTNPYKNHPRHYGEPVTPFRFGVPRSDQLFFAGNDETKQLFENNINALETLGGIKIEIDFTPFQQAALLLYEGPWVAERYIAVNGIIEKNPDALLDVIRTIIGNAESITATQAYSAFYQLQAYAKKAHTTLKEIDFLVTPTIPAPFTIKEVNANPIELNSTLGYYTNFLNLLDCAGIAVNAGFLENGLPWGITFTSRAFNDQKLLAYARLWQKHLSLPAGNDLFVPEFKRLDIHDYDETLAVIVCGAHLSGLPLNPQLTERGAVLEQSTKTSKNYRLYALSGPVPKRPGLIRDESQGTQIDIEVWRIPKTELGSFLAGIPHPLGLGQVETEEGRWFTGFICEAYALNNAEEVSQFGGWKTYLKTL